MVLGTVEHTFARFLRHSVHALGVTMPSPRRRLEFAGPTVLDEAVAWPEAAEEAALAAGVG